MYRKLLVCAIVFYFGCFENPFSSEPDDEPTGPPASIIGYQIVGTVADNDGKRTTRRVGDTLTYRFVDRNTIQGAGFHTIETTDWSYSRSGNTATVHLQYLCDTDKFRQLHRGNTLRLVGIDPNCTEPLG